MTLSLQPQLSSAVTRRPDLSAVRPDAGQRIEVVDAVRGIALLGVLIMNFYSMSGIEFMSAHQLASVQADVDRAVRIMLQVLVDTERCPEPVQLLRLLVHHSS